MESQNVSQDQIEEVDIDDIQERRVSKGLKGFGDFLKNLMDDLGIDVEIPPDTEEVPVSTLFTPQEIQGINIDMGRLHQLIKDCNYDDKSEQFETRVESIMRALVPHIASGPTVKHVRARVNAINNVNDGSHGLILIYTGESFIDTEEVKKVEITVMEKGNTVPVYVIKYGRQPMRHIKNKSLH